MHDGQPRDCYPVEDTDGCRYWVFGPAITALSSRRAGFCTGFSMRAPGYVELQVASNLSFLHGASHPGELVERAFDYGYQSIALTDRKSRVIFPNQTIHLCLENSDGLQSQEPA